MADRAGNYNPRDDTSSWGFNVGPLLREAAKVQPRCGHCGRFLPESLDAFGEHLEGPCPVGGYFNANGVLRGRKECRECGHRALSSSGLAPEDVRIVPESP